MRLSAVGVLTTTVLAMWLRVVTANVPLRRGANGTSVSVSCSNIFPDCKFERNLHRDIRC